MSSYNDEDRRTLRPKKESPAGFLLNMHEYQKSVDWVKQKVKQAFGKTIDECTYDPNIDYWRFYSENEIIVSLPHDIMERIMLVLEKIDWHFERLNMEEFPSEDEDDDSGG